MNSFQASAQLLLHRLRNLAFRAAQLERDRFDRVETADSPRKDLAEMLRTAADTILALAQEFDVRHDPVDSTRRHELGDLCLVAALELRTARNSLIALVDKRVNSDILAQCRRACGVLIQAATSVEESVCGALSTSAELGSLREVESSLHVRRIYGFFRMSIKQLGPPDASNAYDHLIRATSALDDLLCSSKNIRLRVDDRLRLQEAYDRAIPIVMIGPGENTGATVHMAQDLTGLAHLLMTVNDRDVLVQHDLEQLRTLLHRMPEVRGKGPQFDAWLGSLQRLFGRDVELDEILIHGGRIDVERIRAILRRIGQELGMSEMVTTAPNPRERRDD